MNTIRFLFSLILLSFCLWQGYQTWLSTQDQPLTHAPHQPYLWAEEAHNRWLNNAPPKAIAQALLRSIETGPYEPQLVLYRVDLLTQLWPVLTQEKRKIVEEQLRISWKERPRHTAQALTHVYGKALLHKVKQKDLLE